MRIEPRRHLLDIWAAVARHHAIGEEPVGLGTEHPDSLTDAERLLCLLYPATEVPTFRLDQPDLTERDVLAALAPLGDRRAVPAHLITELSRFLHTHTADDGTPSFTAGSCLHADPGCGAEPTDRQRALDVVGSCARSVTLCLAALGFLKVLRETSSPSEPGVRIDVLMEATSARLTAAMIGLLRSFTVDVVDPESARARRLLVLFGPNKAADHEALREFHRRARPLREVIVQSLALGIQVDELMHRDTLFECGWTWGVVRDAPRITGEEDVPFPGQRDGIAAPLPHPYFTLVALDAVQGLFSERTLTLGLLDPVQQRFAEALRLRCELAERYWSLAARFSDRRRPLEDIPWRIPGQGPESEHHSLSVAGIVVHDLLRRRAVHRHDVPRTVTVLERLADRARITSRAVRHDPALALHDPGVTLPLTGSERSGPLLGWRTDDFSAQLLRRTLALAARAEDSAARDRLLSLAEQTYAHLWERWRNRGGAVSLREGRTADHPDVPGTDRLPLWQLTSDLTDGLVAAASLYRQPVLTSLRLEEPARDLLTEATGLWERLHVDMLVDGKTGQQLSRIRDRLDHARALIHERPATALAVAMEVLRELDTHTRPSDPSC